MEPAIPAKDIPNLPRPLTLEQQLIFNTWEATNIAPYEYQVRNTFALDVGRDVLCVAGTGSGKTLSFVMLCFLRPEVILWIVSPLNFIENQQAEQFQEWGLKAVSVNSTTLTADLLEEIKAGKYQVIISSPEAYQDANKLRPALLSPELSGRKHVTAIDECHCIVMWGGSFRKAYLRLGDMRVFMLDPNNAPIIAATATASDSVKVATLHSLKFRPGYHVENLGNFRRSLRFEVFPMSGGRKSYNEICKLLPPPDTDLSDLDQVIVFVEDYITAHSTALAVRKHFKVSGKSARDTFPVYHSLRSELAKRRIERRFKQGKAKMMFSTDALTMGADFANVKMVINYLAPESNECWLQRAGRGGRRKGTVCRAIIMATPKILSDAAKMCQKEDLEVEDRLLNLKIEDREDPDDGPTATSDMRTTESAAPNPKGLYKMTLGMARFLATKGCRVEELDREFNNPPHEPCIDFGGCDRCIQRRGMEEEDRHAAQRMAKREPVDLTIEFYEGPHKELKHKAVKPPNEDERVGSERQAFKKGVEKWRDMKMLELLDYIDICEEAFMSNKELLRIVKYKPLKNVSDFDLPVVDWPGQPEWRKELLDVLDTIKAEEARKREEKEREEAQKREEREKKRAEKEASRAKEEQEQLVEVKWDMAQSLQHPPPPIPPIFTPNSRATFRFVMPIVHSNSSPPPSITPPVPTPIRSQKPHARKVKTLGPGQMVFRLEPPPKQ